MVLTKDDYDEVYSPIVKCATITAFLTWAAHNKAKVFQVDGKTAFLQGRLNDEELYMCQPEDFKDEEKIDKVCKLKKSIHGLKQNVGKKKLKILSSLMILLKVKLTPVFSQKENQRK